MSRQRRLSVVLGLNLFLVSALIAVGLRAHSLGVIAAGGDYLADAAAIGIALLAIWLGARPPTDRRPDGYPRATVIAALINAGWLLILSVLVAGASIVRLVSGTSSVQGIPVVVVSSIAGVLMLAGALVLGGGIEDDDDEDLGMKAVLLDTAADAAAAGGVAVAGLVIALRGGWYWLDPAVALAISVVIGYHTLRLLGPVVSALRKSRVAPETLFESSAPSNPAGR